MTRTRYYLRKALYEVLHDGAAGAPISSGNTTQRTLLSRLWDDEPRHLELLEDCCVLIEWQAVASRGLRAATVRACYRTVQSVKPGIIGYVLGKLMPDFLTALEPMFREASRAAASKGIALAPAFREQLLADPERTVEALLGVTDARIHTARLPIRTAYKTVRHGARDPVHQALPGLAELLEKHLLRS